MTYTHSTAVVHLVRKQNPLNVFQAFVRSYLRYPAGLEHRLVILLKGFDRGLDEAYAAVLKDIPGALLLECPEGGYDLGSYHYAALRLGYDNLLFLNSFSEFAAPDWLRIMSLALGSEHIGAVGATGSWESLATNYLLGHGTLPKLHSGKLRRLQSMTIGALLLCLFPQFPNPHLRTNAFLIPRCRFLSLASGFIVHKIQAWMFESGYHSLTNMIQNSGLKVVIVGRDGKSYETHEWNRSGIFWQLEQENLLVYDNRTRQYDLGADDFRNEKSGRAWG